MLRKIPPKDVTLGMYIQGFGGSWLDHPFWRAHFDVRKERDLDRIHQASIPYVVIDDERGSAVPSGEPNEAPRLAAGLPSRAPAKRIAEPPKLRKTANGRTSQRQQDMARHRLLPGRVHGVL